MYWRQNPTVTRRKIIITIDKYIENYKRRKVARADKIAPR